MLIGERKLLWLFDGDDNDEDDEDEDNDNDANDDNQPSTVHGRKESSGAAGALRPERLQAEVLLCEQKVLLAP